MTSRIMMAPGIQEVPGDDLVQVAKKCLSPGMEQHCMFSNIYGHCFVTLCRHDHDIH
jgi:hypothetical protein